MVLKPMADPEELLLSEKIMGPMTFPMTPCHGPSKLVILTGPKVWLDPSQFWL